MSGASQSCDHFVSIFSLRVFLCRIVSGCLLSDKGGKFLTGACERPHEKSGSEEGNPRGKWTLYAHYPRANEILVKPARNTVEIAHGESRRGAKITPAAARTCALENFTCVETFSGRITSFLALLTMNDSSLLASGH